MANKEMATIKQRLLDFGADFEADLSRAAEWIERNIKAINESITLLKQGKKLSGKKRAATYGCSPRAVKMAAIACRSAWHGGQMTLGALPRAIPTPSPPWQTHFGTCATSAVACEMPACTSRRRTVSAQYWCAATQAQRHGKKQRLFLQENEQVKPRGRQGRISCAQRTRASRWRRFREPRACWYPARAHRHAAKERR